MVLGSGAIVFEESVTLVSDVLDACIMAVKPVVLLELTVRPTVFRKKVPLLSGVALAHVFGVVTSTVKVSWMST